MIATVNNHIHQDIATTTTTKTNNNKNDDDNNNNNNNNEDNEDENGAPSTEDGYIDAFTFTAQ